MQSTALNLLTLARNLYHYENALSKASGENFNPFKILRIGRYEVRTHSPLIAELLNPRGSHGQGAVFLQRFLERLQISDFDAASARVSTEFYIGPQTEEEGGRLDILLCDKADRKILIENKINAGLQKNQLLRYRNFSRCGTLIFLTLYGDAPENLDANLRLKCVSYAQQIIAWLQDCRKEAATAPSVREAISQYIHLLQELTQQNTSTRMNQELIATVLRNEESYLAYRSLCKADAAIRAEILRKLVLQVDASAKSLGLRLDPDVGDLSQKYAGFSFSSLLLQQHGLGICFESGKSDCENWYFGFYNLDKSKINPFAAKLQPAFKAEFGRLEAPTDLWPAWLHWEQHRNWTDDTFAAIQFGTFAEDFCNILQKLLSALHKAADSTTKQVNT